MRESGSAVVQVMNDGADCARGVLGGLLGLGVAGVLLVGFVLGALSLWDSWEAEVRQNLADLVAANIEHQLRRGLPGPGWDNREGTPAWVAWHTNRPR